jgi:hypothetical protein
MEAIMQNPWLVSAANRQMFQEIDEIAMDVWSDDGTLGDLLASLTDDQTDMLFSLKLKSFASNPNDMSCEIELQSP